MIDQNQILLRFHTFQGKLNDLVNKLNDAQEKLAIFEQENILLKNTVKQQDQNLKNLQKNQVNQQKDFVKNDFFHKLVKNYNGSSADSTDLKRTLDEYIKEIDVCIATLSN